MHLKNLTITNFYIFIIKSVISIWQDFIFLSLQYFINFDIIETLHEIMMKHMLLFCTIHVHKTLMTHQEVVFLQFLTFTRIQAFILIQVSRKVLTRRCFVVLQKGVYSLLSMYDCLQTHETRQTYYNIHILLHNVLTLC